MKTYAIMAAVLAVTGAVLGAVLGQVASSGGIPTGLCCLPSGGCRDAFRGGALTELECTNLGGTYAGDGTSCGGADCDWCCMDGEICIVYQSGGNHGACCLEDGDCIFTTQCNCQSPSGNIQGSHTSPGQSCPSPLCTAGACVLLDGTCIVKAEFWCCRRRGSTYLGDGSICDPCSLADLDGDLIVGVSDLLLLLAQWGPCPPDCFADINGDGNINVPDLLILLANWGPCS